MILSDEALLSEISSLEERRYDAMIRGDVTYLSTIFDDGLVYTHGSGTRQDGADYLRGFAAGEDVYREISHGIDRLVRLADSLLVYGWARMSVETGGAMRELDNLSLVVLSRAGDDWKLAAYVSTPRGHAPAQER
jgi:Domain of unknown function (DUF4440)